MNNKIGYARVSTITQKLDSQIDALEKAGCIKIFSEKSSGVKDERVGWKKLMEYIRPGDILVVTELSRMTRSLMHLLKVVKELEEQNISILSLRENIDTTTATGRCFISMIGAISQMERELKAERACGFQNPELGCGEFGVVFHQRAGTCSGSAADIYFTCSGAVRSCITAVAFQDDSCSGVQPAHVCGR